MSNGRIVLSSHVGSSIPCSVFLQRKGDKLLPTESRIHTHDQHVMNHGQDVPNQLNPRGRIQNHPRLHPMMRNEFQRPVQMPASFIVDADPVRARFRESRDVLVRIFDHQMTIERQLRGFARGFAPGAKSYSGG